MVLLGVTIHGNVFGNLQHVVTPNKTTLTRLLFPEKPKNFISWYHSSAFPHCCKLAFQHRQLLAGIDIERQTRLIQQ